MKASKRTSKKTTRISCMAVAIAFASSALAGATGASAATSPVPSGQEPAAQAVVKPALQPCVDQAVSQGVQQWVCTAEGMDIQADAAGRIVDQFVAVEPAPVAEDPGNPGLMQEKAEAPADAGALAEEDYDSWCENGSICSRDISPYVTEVKGNAAYGNQDGVIGTYDAVLRVSLNGRHPNGIVTLIWDSGPALSFNGSRYHCYQVGVTMCGSKVIDDTRVTSTSRRSSSGFVNGNDLTNDADYYNGYETNFIPDGYPQYTAAPLNTHKFTCATSTMAAQCYYF